MACCRQYIFIRVLFSCQSCESIWNACTYLQDGGSSCSSSVSTRSRGEVSPSDLFLGNGANGGGGESRRRGAASGSVLYHPNPLLVYRGHEGVITELAWSKNLFLLSTGMDRQVRLWHISRRECLCAFSHNDTVPAIVFHPKVRLRSNPWRLPLWTTEVDKSLPFIFPHPGWSVLPLGQFRWQVAPLEHSW